MNPRRSLALVIALCLALPVTACSAGPARVSTVGQVAFERPLAIPPVAESTVDDAGTRVVDLTAARGSTAFLAGPETATSGYNGSYLGPTIVASRGEQLAVNLHNALDETTTLHWHGAHLPAEMDGGPHQPVGAGDDWTPRWTVDQPAATLWYHPHPHGETEHQVADGLAGMLIVRDDAEAALALPRDYGVDDVPVIVQDVRFDDDNQFATGERGSTGALGDRVLVNGALGPYLDVSTDVVRLRLLNASTARVYRFVLADERPMAMIASDGGLLAEPFETAAVQLSPGERAEVLVRLSAGERVTLQSRDVQLGSPVGLDAANGGADEFDLLELRAAPVLASRGTLPPTLVPVPELDDLSATVERRFDLDGTQINQREMDLSRIDEVVEVGATEIWDVRNGMALPHNFHVHDVQFQVLDAGGEPPTPDLAGWKDTVYLRPNTGYRLIMRFADYTDPDSPYMFHCHLLAHEDSGMMGQFVVVAPGERAVEPEGHGHGG